MIEPLLTRLRPHAEAFTRALFPVAQRAGRALDIGGGDVVIVEGFGVGTVKRSDGARMTLVDLAARAKKLTAEEAADFAELWLSGQAGEDQGSKMDNGRPFISGQENGTHNSGPAHHRPDVHRLLPQSPDAEKGVICSFLLAPVEVGAFCQKKGVKPSWFHVPSHREIYEELMFLWEERMPIDFIVLTEHFAAKGRLDHVGGAAFITELFTYLPTAANVAYYVEVVDEKHILREMLAFHTKQAARCYEEQDMLPELLAESEAGILAIAGNRATRALDEELAGRRFDENNPPPEPPAILSLLDHVLATPENIFVVAAKVKTGKTAVVGAILACVMNSDGDCLGFRSDNSAGKAVLHFDTEQSRYHHHMIVSRAKRRAKMEKVPKWLFSYYVKGMTRDAMIEALRAEMKRRAAECGGIHLVVLDGSADFCKDLNDPEHAFALVSEIERLEVEYQCVFVCVIHENPGTEIGKTRGHFGSELERKAETPLRLEKDGDGVTVMFCDRARTAFISRENGVRFQWDDEQKMHVITEAEFKPSKNGKTTGARRNSALEAAKVAMMSAFAHGASVRRSLLKTVLTTKQPGKVDNPIGERTFDKYWSEMKDAGLIEDRIVGGVFSASEEWAKEIAGKIPDEGKEL